jgi:hypothetical protein
MTGTAPDVCGVCRSNVTGAIRSVCREHSLGPMSTSRIWGFEVREMSAPSTHNRCNWATTDWATTDWRTTDWATTDWATTDWRTTDWRTTDWRTTDWRTVCGRTARTVRREGSPAQPDFPAPIRDAVVAEGAAELSRNASSRRNGGIRASAGSNCMQDPVPVN